MTVVLLALDETDESISAARRARRLFGPDATYLAVNVAEQLPMWTTGPMVWGGVYPYPYPAPYPLVDEEVAELAGQAVVDDAREVAKALADEAGVHDASAVGEVGDATDAILDAAEAHHADVIVVGSTHKSWWRRLVEGSVSTELARRSHVPILIGGQGDPDEG